VRLVFLGSPPFATPILARLAASPFRPELVVTPAARRRGRGRKTPPSPVAELAREHGFPLEQPESVRDEELLVRLRAIDADIFLVVSYGELLRQEFLDIPRIDCLNVHPSLLPRHRGASPIPAAILAGDRETGVTIQKVVLKLDAGDVLVQQTCEIRPGETTGELTERLLTISADAVIEALEKVERGELETTPQDPERVTLCRKLTKETGLIDWERTAEELERHVCAMNPWPLARTALPDGMGLAVRRAKIVENPANTPGGRILSAKDRFLVSCGEGALELTEVQAAGKRAMEGEAFLRGARLEEGGLLGGVR
jgi:methionyl-tRNA formyltransferase